MEFGEILVTVYMHTYYYKKYDDIENEKIGYPGTDCGKALGISYWWPFKRPRGCLVKRTQDHWMSDI